MSIKKVYPLKEDYWFKKCNGIPPHDQPSSWNKDDIDYDAEPLLVDSNNKSYPEDMGGTTIIFFKDNKPILKKTVKDCSNTEDRITLAEDINWDYYTLDYCRAKIFRRVPRKLKKKIKDYYYILTVLSITDTSNSIRWAEMFVLTDGPNWEYPTPNNKLDFINK